MLLEQKCLTLHTHKCSASSSHKPSSCTDTFKQQHTSNVLLTFYSHTLWRCHLHFQHMRTSFDTITEPSWRALMPASPCSAAHVSQCSPGRLPALTYSPLSNAPHIQGVKTRNHWRTPRCCSDTSHSQSVPARLSCMTSASTGQGSFHHDMAACREACEQTAAPRHPACPFLALA